MVQESIVTPMLRKLKGKIKNLWSNSKEFHKADLTRKLPPIFFDD